GRRRAFWLGFALVGWTYPTLIFGPWFKDTLGTNMALVGLVDQFEETASRFPLPALKPGETIQYRFEAPSGRWYWVVRQTDGSTYDVLAMSRRARAAFRGAGHGCV